MSADELNTLREEAAPPPAEAVADAPPADILPPVDAGLQQALGQVVRGLSAPICRKARVTDLEAGEADALGASLALLVTVYDVGPKDPKGAAWMGFGLTVVGVIGNRRRLPPEPGEEGPAAVAAQVDAPAVPTPGLPPFAGQLKMSNP